MNISKELIAKAKEANNAEELMKIAEENNVKLSPEEAEKYFVYFNTEEELSDEELDNVAGGATVNGETIYYNSCSISDPKHKEFKVNDRVWIKDGDGIPECRGTVIWVSDIMYGDHRPEWVYRVRRDYDGAAYLYYQAGLAPINSWH